MNELQKLIAEPGPNDVVWTDPAFPNRPLTLRSARPRRYTPETPLLIVHHGVLRNGADYRDYWLPLVDEADLLVVVPECSTESFPGVGWYNFGNLRDEAGHLNPRAKWTYGLDEHVFAALREAGVTKRRYYGLFGHSAGGQFVHRSLSLGFRSHVAAAVSANAGNYAMPDPGIEFPYGLAGTGTTEADLRALLAFRLTVMAGTADIDATSDHFPKTPESMAQGPTRHARAHTYIGTARAAAAARGMACAWTIVDVAGVDHDGNRMGQAAAPLLSAALHAAEAFPAA